MDLFEEVHEANRMKARPLAARMRPRSIQEFIGQEHFFGEGKLLRRMLLADRLNSLVFYGPPGTGKTALAQVIANHTKSRFVRLNAVNAGTKEVREILLEARKLLETEGERTILFLDEMHRFNKSQQDVLLPDVEDGAIILIGATTQNPFFAINTPLLSRSQIFTFESLSKENILTLLKRAIADSERGLGESGVIVDPEALEFLAVMCDGDARRALTALEIAAKSCLEEQPHVTLAAVQDSIQRKLQDFDPTGDSHYDLASAFIKSMRGSDPDAAIYWLARMLESGEDPRFIARRLVIFASEDVGNADPRGIMVATAVWNAVEMVGLPECQLNLAQGVTFLASCQKSNSSTVAIGKATTDVREGRTLPVPKHLKDSHYSGAKTFGHGEGYVYSHSAPDAWVDQEYLPEDRRYYLPSDRGHEAIIKKFLDELRSRKKGGSA
ncbi:replication-associated recombination protein A [Telmatocola sphagniphila]|uniref:Replication-associated recombination protein A n=2 Tax=Telmatocola sphagniphila TaxID=1123043 RepID=A0A8E6BCT9_9BACT|nr:replication-associated recombination protein A [Telmatocola sphagniphila]